MSSAGLSPRPLSSLRITRHQIPSHHLIPNTSIQHHPLLIYHCCFPPSSSLFSASAIESHLKHTNIALPQWRYTMYPTTHFHSTAHEVLCVSRGSARLLFGGEENPGRVEMVVEKGDVVIVPAGVGHRLLEDLQGGFEMVGAYERGSAWDMCYGREGEEEKVQGIAGLGWFEEGDPIYGRGAEVGVRGGGVEAGVAERRW